MISGQDFRLHAESVFACFCLGLNLHKEDVLEVAISDPSCLECVDMYAVLTEAQAVH